MGVFIVEISVSAGAINENLIEHVHCTHSPFSALLVTKSNSIQLCMHSRVNVTIWSGMHTFGDHK